MVIILSALNTIPNVLIREKYDMKQNPLLLPGDYAQWLTSLKQRIQGARQRALLAVNSEQIRLYHEIGREILERQDRQGWGAKVIDQLSADLRAAFPDMKGFSSRNLKYMKVFAQECPDLQIGQQSAAQLPWFHVITLLTKITDPAVREWYAREAVAQSWPRDTLNIQIKNRLHLRQGAAVTNFDRRLAPGHAGLAAQILKDPYHFVAEYQLVRALPEPLDVTLPSIEEIEAQLARDLEIEGHDGSLR
jgi:predicted nuclease of restriction endonuclease-like (RecB) superfamily